MSRLPEDFWDRQFDSDHFDNAFFWIVAVILIVASLVTLSWYYVDLVTL